MIDFRLVAIRVVAVLAVGCGGGGCGGGGSSLVRRGIGFVQSTQVQIKFSDGRREATVAGKYISDTEITCNSPSFEKFGPMEVMVRVSIKSDPFTVNKAMFAFFVNTKAAKSMAFGPGLLPNAGKAGRPLSFNLVAKDPNGKARVRRTPSRRIPQPEPRPGTARSGGEYPTTTSMLSLPEPRRERKAG